MSRAGRRRAREARAVPSITRRKGGPTLTTRIVPAALAMVLAALVAGPATTRESRTIASRGEADRAHVKRRADLISESPRTDSKHARPPEPLMERWWNMDASPTDPVPDRGGGRIGGLVDFDSSPQVAWTSTATQISRNRPTVRCPRIRRRADHSPGPPRFGAGPGRRRNRPPAAPRSDHGSTISESRSGRLRAVVRRREPSTRWP